jgi:hypothetical protein
MSTYFKMWNSTIEAPDPDAYVKTEATPIGKFSNGLPVVQGRESGVCTWTVMRLSDWHDLYDRWNTNKASAGTFVVPPHSGDDWDTWRSITAWCDPPTAEYRGNQVQNVTVTLHVRSALA